MIQLFILLLVAGLPNVALAYIGPGAGISTFGTIIALLGAILLMIVGFIWYPTKRILERFRSPNKDIDENNTARNQAETEIEEPAKKEVP